MMLGYLFWSSQDTYLQYEGLCSLLGNKRLEMVELFSKCGT